MGFRQKLCVCESDCHGHHRGSIEVTPQDQVKVPDGKFALVAKPD